MKSRLLQVSTFFYHAYVSHFIIDNTQKLIDLQT